MGYPDHTLQGLYISSDSLESVGAWINTLAIGTSANWPTANKAFYWPLILDRQTVVKSIFAVNTATVANSFDIGIYRMQDLLKLVSTGSTARSGTSVIQNVSVTRTLLLPGNYFFAMAVNGTSSGSGGLSLTGANARDYAFVGIYEQTSAFALPSTATPVATTAAYLPLIGFITG